MRFESLLKSTDHGQLNRAIWRRLSLAFAYQNKRPKGWKRRSDQLVREASQLQDRCDWLNAHGMGHGPCFIAA